MLGKKQAISNEDWLRAWKNIENLVRKEEIDALVDQTVEEIKKNIKGRKVAYAWSGGKDSLALQFVMEQIDLFPCFFIRTNLEYPAFLRWVHSHKPRGLTIINTGHDLKWLSQNLSMLFPKQGVPDKWDKLILHQTQDRYYRQNQLDMLILGRRKADGNYTGKSTIYTTKKGMTRYNPLRDWKHEHVLGLIHYYQIPLPPIYKWPNGFKVGTGNWAERPYTGSIQQGWKEVYTIDPSIVEKAATLIPSAREFLEKKQKE